MLADSDRQEDLKSSADSPNLRGSEREVHSWRKLRRSTHSSHRTYRPLGVTAGGSLVKSALEQDEEPA
jgi:hypothetical protein